MGWCRYSQRGPRKQRLSIYFKLKKKEPTHHSGDVEGLILLSQALADLMVLDWKVVRNKPHCWCIVSVEAWSSITLRVSTKIVIDQERKSGNSFVSIKAHECQKDLSNIPGFCSIVLTGSLHVDWLRSKSTVPPVASVVLSRRCSH